MVVEEFSKYAPTLDGAGVTKIECDAVELPIRTYSSTTPTLTKTKVLSVINDIPKIEEFGIMRLSVKSAVSEEQFKKILKEFMLSKNPPEKVVVVKEIEEIIVK